jgi:hypothetical protein
MAENWQNMAKNVSNVFHDLKNLRIAQRSLKICQFWRILATFAPITFHDGCRCFYLRYVIHSRRKSDTFIVFFLFHGSAPSLNLEKAIKWGCYILNVWKNVVKENSSIFATNLLGFTEFLKDWKTWKDWNGRKDRKDRKDCWKGIKRLNDLKGAEGLLKRTAEKDCWKRLLKRTAEKDCWKGLLKRTAEKDCWKGLLKRTAKKDCWKRLLKRTAEMDLKRLKDSKRAEELRTEGLLKRL